MVTVSHIYWEIQENFLFITKLRNVRSMGTVPYLYSIISKYSSVSIFKNLLIYYQNIYNFLNDSKTQECIFVYSAIKFCFQLRIFHILCIYFHRFHCLRFVCFNIFRDWLYLCKCMVQFKYKTTNYAMN